jgi:hypothetical protein
MSEFGVKYDQGKLPIATILSQFPSALEAVTAVGEFGARKYVMGGWKLVPNGLTRYTDAMIRHWIEECKGETVDSDSELLHAAHLAWNALARLEFIIDEQRKSRCVSDCPGSNTSIEGFRKGCQL